MTLNLPLPRAFQLVSQLWEGKKKSNENCIKNSKRKSIFLFCCLQHQRFKLFAFLVDRRIILVAIAYVYVQKNKNLFFVFVLFSHFNFIHFISRDGIVSKFGIHSLPSTFCLLFLLLCFFLLFYLFLILSFLFHSSSIVLLWVWH